MWYGLRNSFANRVIVITTLRLIDEQLPGWYPRTSTHEARQYAERTAAEAATVHIDTVRYQRTLGDELRRARKQRGWTRRDLQSRLQSEISLQTLATYELGTRQCSVVRLVELCLAMDQQPHELLARVDQRAFADDTSDRIRIDLAAAAASSEPELLPLRRWASGRLHEVGGTKDQEIALDLPALERLAELCNLDTVELIRRLRGLG